MKIIGTKGKKSTIADVILEKVKSIKNKSKLLDVLIVKYSHSDLNLKKVLFWLMQHGYDTFICNDVLNILKQPANADEGLLEELDRLVTELKAIFSGCLSPEPCNKMPELELKTKLVCSHVEGECHNIHVTIHESANIVNFFRLIALIFWAGEFSKVITIEARGGGSVREGEISAMGVNAGIVNTRDGRGHHCAAIKRSGFNDSIMFAVTKTIARAAGGGDHIVTVCEHGRHRSRIVSTVAGIVLKTLLYGKGFTVNCIHNNT